MIISKCCVFAFATPAAPSADSDTIWPLSSSSRRKTNLFTGLSSTTRTRNDPALHTACIKAALRIETYGPEVHNNWDVYALLRRQYKPAEMVVIPRGSHALARPSERMISLQGNVDWYRFWLNGEQRSELVLATETAASLNEQYVRWRQMEGFKRVVDAQPGCARVVGGE